MPVSVFWDNDENTVMVVRFDGLWTWDELYQAFDAGNKLIETTSSTPYVDVVVDWTNHVRLPPNTLSHGGKLITKRHEKVDITIMVGGNSFISAMWNIFSKLNNKLVSQTKFFFTDTMEEAREIVRRQRSQSE